MSCHVEADGALSNCKLIKDSPPSARLGLLLLSTSTMYRRRPPVVGDPREMAVVLDWHDYDRRADWVRKPSSDDILAVWPTGALKQGISGEAIINCAVTNQGAVSDCVVTEETPTGLGFGAAAIALTPQFRMKPATWKGVPVVSMVSVPVRFHGPGPGRSLTGESKVLPVNLAWATAPSHVDVLAAYPKRALAKGVGGRSTLACEVSRDGRLKACAAIEPDRTNFGFDTAALSLAKQFRLNVVTPEDVAATTKLVVHLPFTFDPAMSDQRQPIVGKPTWARLPSGQEMQTAFQKLDTPGTVRTVLNCTVEQGGTLGGCEVDSESAPGAGAVALTLMPRFKVSTWTMEGLPTVGGTIRVPLRYEAEAAPTSTK